MRLIFKILFGLSILANGLLLFWGNEQKNAAHQIDSYWKSRDEQRRQSIEFLSSNLVGKLTKERILEQAKSENRDFFEKEGQLVLDDIIFSFGEDGHTVTKIEAFKYQDK